MPGRLRLRTLTAVALAAAAAVGVAALPGTAGAGGGIRTTTTTLTGTKAVTGQPVVFTATVTDPKATVPGGSVTFTVTASDGSTPMCDGGSNQITVTANAANNGAEAQCSISAGLTAAASPYTVTAAYSGDPSDSPSTATPLLQKIKLGPTTTTVVTALSPTVSGQPVSFTATVAAASPAVGSPTGSVTFSITGAGGSTATCDAGDQVPLTSGSASCSLAGGLLAGGSPFTVSAVYSGDTQFATSTGSVTQDVSPDATTLALTSIAGNGEGPANTAVSGQTVSFTATVTPGASPGAGLPSGNVIFAVTGADGVSETCDGGDTLALVAASPPTAATATCAFPDGLLARAQTYTVTAQLKDPSYSAPTTASLVETVTAAPTTVTLSVPTSVTEGQPLKLKATVTTVGEGSGTPTGVVTFGVCSTNKCLGGGTVTLPSAKNAGDSVSASLSLPGGLPAGFYDVTASYSGGANYSSSVSSTATLDVQQLASTTTIVVSHDPVNAGHAVILRAVVEPATSPDSQQNTPSGTVTFTVTGASGDTLTCEGGSNTFTLDTNALDEGLAACVIPSGTLTSGDAPYAVVAAYSGDRNYEKSQATLSLAVG